MNQAAPDFDLAQHTGIRLDIGCGGNKQPNFVGMDVRPLPGVDIVHDIHIKPWPLEDNSVLVAMCSHLVEHIPPVVLDNGRTRFLFIEFMDEVWRILKPGADFMISLPHGYSPGYLQDPTHVNACNEATWAYFDPFEQSTNGMLWNIYKPKPWRIRYLTWNPTANIEVILVKRGLDELEVADD